MSSSILLTSNTTSNAVAANGVIPLGNAVHGFGKGIRLNGNEIDISVPGYYDVSATVTMAVTGEVAPVISLNRNGTAVASGSATPGAAGDTISVNIPWIVRKSGCACMTDALTLTSSLAGTVSSVIVKVERV